MNTLIFCLLVLFFLVLLRVGDYLFTKFRNKDEE